MAAEIERKFLVDLVRAPLPASGIQLRQGYLVRDAQRSVRVRLSSDTASGSAEAWITVKGADGIERAEYEYPIPVGDAAALLDDLCLPGQIDKTRYLVPVEGRTFEVDVFAGRHAGLAVAEVELKAADEAVTIPGWVTAEVTGDPAWTNAAMSDPDWHAPAEAGG
jgi:adenylate cyclase